MNREDLEHELTQTRLQIDLWQEKLKDLQILWWAVPKTAPVQGLDEYEQIIFAKWVHGEIQKKEVAEALEVSGEKAIAKLTAWMKLSNPTLFKLLTQPVRRKTEYASCFSLPPSYWEEF